MESIFWLFEFNHNLFNEMSSLNALRTVDAPGFDSEAYSLINGASLSCILQYRKLFLVTLIAERAARA